MSADERDEILERIGNLCGGDLDTLKLSLVPTAELEMLRLAVPLADRMLRVIDGTHTRYDAADLTADAAYRAAKAKEGT